MGPGEARGGGPRQEEASSASLERSGLPAGQESLFKARGLAFTCQLVPKVRREEGEGQGPRVTQALGRCQEAPEALLPTSPGTGFKASF